MLMQACFESKTCRLTSSQGFNSGFHVLAAIIAFGEVWGGLLGFVFHTDDYNGHWIGIRRCMIHLCYATQLILSLRFNRLEDKFIVVDSVKGSEWDMRVFSKEGIAHELWKRCSRHGHRFLFVTDLSITDLERRRIVSLTRVLSETETTTDDMFGGTSSGEDETDHDTNKLKFSTEIWWRLDSAFRAALVKQKSSGNVIGYRLYHRQKLVLDTSNKTRPKIVGRMKQLAVAIYDKAFQNYIFEASKHEHAEKHNAFDSKYVSQTKQEFDIRVPVPEETKIRNETNRRLKSKRCLEELRK